MNEAVIVNYGLGGRVEGEREIELGGFKKRAFRHREKTPSLRVFLGASSLEYESVLGDLLPRRNEWQELKNEIRSLPQKNPLIQEETVVAAKRLVGLLKPHGALPEISVGPSGEIDFDWMHSKDWTLTLSVCPNREVAHAGIFDIKGSQACDNDYELPIEVIAYLEAFNRVQHR